MSFVTVAIAGSKVYSQLQAGSNAKGQAYLQASQADYQAKVEQENALKTAAVIRRAGRHQAGQATAAYAGAGVQVGAGSAGEAERQINLDVEHDAFQALLDGGRRSSAASTEAKLLRINGDLQQSAATASAVSSALGSMYSGMRSNGWRTQGPGFSGTQTPAPVEVRTPRKVG